MKRFGFKKLIPNSKKINYLLKIDFLFLFLIFLAFLSFNFISHYSRLVFADNKIDVLENSLKDIALLFYSVDSSISSSFLTLDKVITDYKNGEDVLKKDYTDILFLSNVYQKKVHYLLKYGLTQYKDFLLFIGNALDYKEDIFDLLGKNEPQKYLVLFQNNSEKRPNGGFFGSFAVVTIDKLKIDYKILDSYYPDFVNPNGAVQTPSWAKNIFLDSRIGFIAANKFGFTDMDSKNIIQIYENTFPGEKIRGVVFINSNFFEDILPGFVEKMREWQFVNASIDLIRGKNLPYKKELYIKDMMQYINKNKSIMISNSIKNFDKLLDENNLRVYFNGVSSGFNDFLEEKSLITYHRQNKIYFWDYNNGYNKIDRFVSKLIEIYDSKGVLVVSTNKDVVDISKFQKGMYTAKIAYNINMPNSYVDYIHKLEEKYNIRMTEREIHILGLNNLWDDRGIVYLPLNTQVISIQGESYENDIFSTPFSNNVYYKLKTTSNNDMKYFGFKFNVE